MRLPGQAKRWIPFAARSADRAFRNDSLFWIVEAVSPDRHMIPWSSLSDTTFESMRKAEPPIAWIPYREAKFTTLFETTTLVQPSLNWMQRFSARVTVKPSIVRYERAAAKNP